MNAIILSAFATGHLKEENCYVLHELADRVRQPSVLRECNLLEFGQGLLVAHLARPVLAQIRFFADSGLGRGHVLEIIDELLDVVNNLDGSSSLEDSDHLALFATFVCRWRRRQMSRIFSQSFAVSPRLWEFSSMRTKSPGSPTYLFATSSASEKSRMMWPTSSSKFGSLQLRLWQRARRRLFMRRGIFPQADGLTASRGVKL